MVPEFIPFKTMVIFAFKSYQLDQKLLKEPFSEVVVFDVITRGVLGVNLTVAMLRGHVAPSHLVSSTHGDFYSFTAFAKVPLAQVSLNFIANAYFVECFACACILYLC